LPPVDADFGVAKNVENSLESDESDEEFRKDGVDHHARRRPKKEKVGYFLRDLSQRISSYFVTLY
jgi:hypothetical protein